MQNYLETIASYNFAPKPIEAAASAGKRPPRGSGERAPFDEAKRLLDLSCAVLPREAAMCVISLLYLETLVCCKDGLSALLKKLLDEKDAPALHYETNAEELLLAELFCGLLAAGASREDWAFVSTSGCVTNGIAWYATAKAREYLRVADITTALNLEAIRGEMGAFDDRLSSIARPYQGQIDCAANVRRLVEGSQMTTDEGRYAFGYDTHPRVQDAICVRATPQTHGGARDVCYFAQESVEKSVFGGCGGYGVEYALDGLETAVSDTAHICERRTFRLCDSRLSYGLPMNLTHGATGLNHGFPVVQSNQAALVAELKLLALPSAVVKEPGECAAYYAGTKMLRALPLFAKVMAIELLMTCQGMDIVKEKLPEFRFGKGTAAVKDKVRESIAMMTENRFVSPDMNEADRLITNGEILKAAEKAVGSLR
ncbi:MAG: aromatic amino acid lyase [bacterium]|nr:aromatic amino acid lyase [bacterium]